MDIDLRYPSISDLREKARRRIPHFVFEYLDSATGVEDQHRRNRADLGDVRFWPDVLRGPMAFDVSTSFLGREYPVPFGCAPVGMSGIMWPRAEKILAKACATAGIPYGMSTVATVVPEQLAPHIGDQGWFQLYMPHDTDIRADILRRAKEAGFRTLVLTVDTPLESRRERQRRANLTIPPKINLEMLVSMALHPAWTIGTLREGIPSLKFCDDYAAEIEATSVAHAGHDIRGAPSWDDVAALREMWDGPFMLKGIQQVEDARRMADLGCDAVWVSNHSGRQFDGGPSSIECLPAIREAVPEMPIVFDSGINGGLDILRALALGADFVMLGRAFHYAVGALGERGPQHLVDMLKDDMISCMGQIGAERLSDLAGRLVR